MSSSSGEYLRRKMAAMPKTLGPAVYGDSSQRTYVVRMRNTPTPTTRGPTLTKSTEPSCCKGRPAGGPYNNRNGDGQQQEWSTESLLASRVNFCEPLPGRKEIPGCCPPPYPYPRDRPAGIFYDTSGIPMTAAYQGAKSKCCKFQATLASIAKVQEPSRCACATDPSTRINTLLANNMPNDEIPFPPAQKPCCTRTYVLCTCCGADNKSHFCYQDGTKYYRDKDVDES